MAVEMITWARRQVFDLFGLSGPERFILMLLADNASFDEETGAWIAFPFQNTLAKESGFNERTVQRALKRFKDLGLMTVEVRYKKGGGKSGNTYRFHPEVVEQPIVRTEANPENSRHDTESGLEYPGHDTESGMGSLPREFKTRHRVGYENESTHTRQSAGSDTTQSRVPRAVTNAGASLTVIEPSSSSSASATTEPQEVLPSKLGRDDDETNFKGDEDSDESFGVYEGVDLDRVAGLLAHRCAVTPTREQLAWLTDEILSRSRRGRPGNPGQYVARALELSGDQWATFMVEEFSRAVTGSGSAVRDPGDSRKCPIQHHADSGWLARNCPGCRKQLDFPKVLDRSTYEALEADVQALVDRDRTVTIVDMTEASVRSRDRNAG